jgi:NhaP-type Na+/H+ or K+/H+ antiporter
VVSLAAALSIPEVLPDGTPFPMRGVVLVITFVVILLTLVGQGLTLPWLVRTLRVADVDHHAAEEEQELALRADLAGAVVAHLDTNDAGAPHVARARAKYARVHSRSKAALDDLRTSSGDHHTERDLHRQLIGVQRQALVRLRDAGAYDDEVVRKAEHALDIEEERLNDFEQV